MKNLLKFTVLLLFTFHFSLITFGQTPTQFKYQAVLRDASGNVMASKAVTVGISILQGSVSGTSVFTEQHSVTTTSQGLINLNIGSVADLSTVDFSSDTYFIEISVNGTVMGISQLLSVPYALQAKNVENVDYSQISNTPDLSSYITSENDPVFSTWDKSTGILITESQISDFGTYLTSETDPVFSAWDKDYADLSNKPANATTTTDGFMSSADKTKLDGLTNADGSETKVTAGTNVNITGTGTSGDPYVVNVTASGSTHYVGELYGGGVVFWVDHTGEHGLILSMVDLSTVQAWSDVTSTEIGSAAQSDWDGQTNSTNIIAQSTATSAADICADYTNADYGTGIYSDWYLPSIAELNHIWNNLYEVQKAIDTYENGTTTMSKKFYWSSSEGDAYHAFQFNFNLGYANSNVKSDQSSVRAVRAF